MVKADKLPPGFVPPDPQSKRGPKPISREGTDPDPNKATTMLPIYCSSDLTEFRELFLTTTSHPMLQRWYPPTHVDIVLQKACGFFIVLVELDETNESVVPHFLTDGWDTALLISVSWCAPVPLCFGLFGMTPVGKRGLKYLWMQTVRWWYLAAGSLPQVLRPFKESGVLQWDKGILEKE